MNIEIGDKIKIRKDLMPGPLYGKVESLYGMDLFLRGKEMIVSGIYPDGTFDAHLVGDCEYDYWISPEMTDEGSKKTRYKELMSMSVEEVAKNHIGWHTTFKLYFTSDGKAFEQEDYDEALKHEIDWWNEEVES